jgi:hypothetical protein
MGAPAKKADLALIFGGPKKPPAAGAEPDGDEMGGAPPADEGGDEPSEAYKTAIQETGLPLDDEQQAALWRAIKECTGSY